MGPNIAMFYTYLLTIPLRHDTRSIFKSGVLLLLDKWEQKIYHYLPTPPLGQDITRGQFLSGV